MSETMKAAVETLEVVTTDVPAAAGFLWAAYYGLRFVGRPDWRRATAAAVGLGLAMSCKFTYATLAPAGKGTGTTGGAGAAA